MRKCLSVAAWACSFFLLSCGKLFIEPDLANTPTHNFDQLWSEMDARYSFFEYKGVDWNAVYRKYRPRVSDEMSKEELFEVLSQMIREVKDGHVSLTADFRSYSYQGWYLNYPPNFNFTVLERNYLGSNYINTGHLLVKKIGSVGYIYCRTFGGTLNESEVEDAMQAIGDSKGIILDVRDNRGGSIHNAKRLAARFATTKTLFAYNVYKKGPGHSDFHAPEPQYVYPSGTYYGKEVVVLTNRSTFSAGNDFVMLMKALPKTTIMGDSTGGGGGIPNDSQLFNGWQYRYSTTMTLLPDFRNVENGIAPDIKIDASEEDEKNGKDTLLEAALHFFNH